MAAEMTEQTWGRWRAKNRESGGLSLTFQVDACHCGNTKGTDE